MKLRNKKTGEIRELPDGLFCGDNLKKICEEWEDYEEPRKYWYINSKGDIYRDDIEYSEWIEESKSIGNDFETREEAEKAVEKLKAWKRLKDKGFRFTGIAGVSNNIYVSFETDSKYSGGHIMYDKYNNTDNKLREYNEDLMLLFGGEE